MSRLVGKVCLVTGAGRGIGASAAKAMAAEGAKVYCMARSKEEIESVAREITSCCSGTATAVVADLTAPETIKQLYNQIYEESGGLDVLFANAGISGLYGVDVFAPDLDINKWKEIIDVNLVGTFNSIRMAIPLLNKSAGKKIIVTGSGTGHFPVPGHSAYGCSKAGLWMLVRALAEDLKEKGIAINEVIPGPVATGLLKNTTAQRKNIGDPIPQEWIKEPDEVVPLVMFLATQPEGAGPTGQSFSLTRRPI
ncbi:MAG: SDR family oxidoreductase [Porticoccaceae bacterium]